MESGGEDGTRRRQQKIRMGRERERRAMTISRKREAGESERSSANSMAAREKERKG